MFRKFTLGLLCDKKEDEVVVDTSGSDVSIDDSNPDETVVNLTPEKKETASSDDARWARAEAENAQLRARLDNLQYSPPVQRQEQSDPYAQQLETIADRQRAMGIEWETLKAANALTPDKHKEYFQKAQGLEQEKANIAAQRAIQTMLPQMIQQQQVQQLRSNYTDVNSHPSASKFAKGTYEIMLSEGHPDNAATVEKAMNAARIKYGMTPSGVSHGPSEQDKRQLTGIAGGGGRQVSDNTVKMGKPEKIMAQAMYGEAFNGDEKKVNEAWAKRIGLKAKKEAEKARRQAR